jgi:hypothetical protein
MSAKGRLSQEWGRHRGPIALGLPPLIVGACILFARLPVSGSLYAADELASLDFDALNVSTSLLNPVTGHYEGRMVIDSIRRDYGHDGPFRVAWKPLLLLDGVTVDVADATRWAQVAPTLMRGRPFQPSAEREVQIRGIVIRVGSPCVVVTGATATVSPSGEFILDHGSVAAPGEPTRSFARLRVPLLKPVPSVWAECKAEEHPRPPLFNSPESRPKAASSHTRPCAEPMLQ